MAASPIPPALATVGNIAWPQVERFIGLFAHDLRNGLNSVELQLTLLGETSDDPGVKDEVKRIRASVGDVTRQLHAVRLSTGAPSLHLLSYPAADFAEDLRERFEREHPGVGARIRWQIGAGTRSLSVDPDLSMIALLELLDNSLAFAPGESTIEFRTEQAADSVTFSIRQDAPAAPADPPDAWGLTPFTSTRRDGYGLGAFRARRIIEAQKGSLQFAYMEADHSLLTTVVLPAVVVG